MLNSCSEQTTHKITYIVDDTIYEEMTILSGESIIAIAEPQKENATFSGWYSDQACTLPFTFEVEITSDISIYGKFSQIKENTFIVTFNSDGGTTINEQVIEENGHIAEPAIPSKPGHVFKGWYTDNDETEKWYFAYNTVSKDLTLKAKWEIESYKVTFETNGGSTTRYQNIEYNNLVTIPTEPKKRLYNFKGWYQDIECTIPWNFSTDKVTCPITLYAKWALVQNKTFTVNYILPNEIWPTKDDLYIDFFGYFYDFLVNHTDCDMSGIASKDDFLRFCKTWEVNDRRELYHVGDRFSAYFLTKEENGLLENQPATTFIGYCYQNNQFVDVIRHLITFFAYWRTDEGYDPSDIHGKDFFWGAWAALVDTAKFFYFTSSNLHDKYSWFNSERVNNALDNIPGVCSTNISNITFKAENYILLDNIIVPGYDFMGWYLEDTFETTITIITEEMVLAKVGTTFTFYAKLNKQITE